MQALVAQAQLLRPSRHEIDYSYVLEIVNIPGFRQGRLLTAWLDGAPTSALGPFEHREIRVGQRELREGQDRILEELRRLSERNPEASREALTARYGGDWVLVYITPEGSAVGRAGPDVQIDRFRASLRIVPGATVLTVHELVGRIGNLKNDPRSRSTNQLVPAGRGKASARVG